MSSASEKSLHRRITAEQVWKKWKQKIDSAAGEFRIIPYDELTMVLPFDNEEVTQRLSDVTKPLDEQRMRNDLDYYLFSGRVGNFTFSLTRMLNYPNNFVPVIEGVIESTSMGSLVFLKYRMIKSTQFMLVFWSVLALFASFFFTVVDPDWRYAVSSTVLMFFNYWISIANFNRQKKVSHELLMRLFS